MMKFQTLIPATLVVLLFSGYLSAAKTAKNIGIFNVVKFNNDPCDGDNSKNGTCYTEDECSNKGGKAEGSCAEGYGVCCVFSLGCGDSISENGTYFESSASVVGQCNLRVCPCNENICQLRLDFMNFVIAGPSTVTTTVGSATAGEAVGDGEDVIDVSRCIDDQFSVTSPGNAAPPVICGTNTGDHMYVNVETGSTCSDLVFSLSSSSTVQRSWAIKITQYSCDYINKAPEGCLQWFFGSTTGTIQSFNWANKQHLADQNQNICVRRESNTCQICYTQSSDDDFQISGMADAMAVIACGYGADGMATDYDQLIIPAPSKLADGANIANDNGFCGALLGSAAGGDDATICSKRLPFMVRFVTDGFEFANEGKAGVAAMDNHQGFSVDYKLNSC